MAKFVKKPIVIEASQWWVNGDHENVTFYLNKHTNSRPDGVTGGACRVCGVHLRGHGYVDTLEGGHIVCPGDWIITGVKGEQYPCKPDIFEETYDRADCPG